MRKWPAIALAGLAALGVGTAVPVWAATAAPSDAGGSQVAGYALSTMASAVRYQLNSPGLLPVGDPREGNIMEVDMPFARIGVSQGPVISALGSPLYGGDTLAHLGTAVVTFGAPPPFSALNYPVVAEADYPPSPGHTGTQSFGQPAGTSGGVTLGGGTATSHAGPDSASVEAHLGDFAVPSSGPLVQVGGSTSTNQVSVKDALVTSQASSSTNTVTIAGMITIAGITASATSTSDGTTGKPTAHFDIGKVEVAGQAAYIDSDGVHIAGQQGGVGVVPGLESLLAKTLTQDGISVHTISPQTTVKDGLATADAGGLAIVLDRTVPALSVPGAGSVDLPGVGPVPLGTPDLPLHVELILGQAKASANATSVPAFSGTTGGDTGGIAPAVEGLTQVNDFTASGAGSSVTNALSPVPSGGSGARPSTQQFVTASTRPPNGAPIPVAWILAGIFACIVLMGPLLGYARWQLLEGRPR